MPRKLKELPEAYVPVSVEAYCCQCGATGYLVYSSGWKAIYCKPCYEDLYATSN